MPLHGVIKMNDAHFKKLAVSRGEGCEWLAGRVPSQWALNVGLPKQIIERLPGKKLNRAELRDFCSNADPSAAVATVLAWGGMKVAHGKRIVSPSFWAKLKPIAAELKQGELHRKTAYDTLMQYRAENRGCGLGPAYFTKLIYFLDPKHNGYIMDQWTSLSVNLVFSKGGRPIVDMVTSTYRGRRTDTVSDKNKPDNYDAFCLCIEHLAEKLGTTDPSTAEEWAFSRGGKSPAPWRAYVLANRP